MASLEGADDLRARLRAVDHAPREVARTWGLLTVRLMKERVRRKTGHTARTIKLVAADENGATVEVAGAGLWLERGTAPHIIRPRRRKVLRFPSSGTPTTLSGRPTAAAVRRGGAWRFARQVRHPGTKPYPFALSSGRDALNMIGIDSIIEAWNRAR